MAETRDSIVIMHIADMHFGIPERRQTSSYRQDMIDTLIERVSGLPDNRKPDILVVSGDIAWRGSDTDFKLAEEFFFEFFTKEGINIKESDTVVCFGNHDVDTEDLRQVPSNSNQAFDKLLVQSNGSMGDFVDRPPIDSAVTSMDRAIADKYALSTTDVEKYYHRFEKVEQFCSNMGFKVLLNPSTCHKYRHAYGSCRIKGVDFICLNTEWDFFGKTDKDHIAKGHLRVGQALYRAANAALESRYRYRFIPFAIGVPARFVVTHRSQAYLHESEQYSNDPFDFDKRVGNLIYSNDVSLNGHEHVPDLEFYNYTLHTRISAGAIHTTDRAEFSFNLITIPKKLAPGSNQCKSELYIYRPGRLPTWDLVRDKTKNFHITRLEKDSRLLPLLDKFDKMNIWERIANSQRSVHGNMIATEIESIYSELTQCDFDVLQFLLGEGFFDDLRKFSEECKHYEPSPKPPKKLVPTPSHISLKDESTKGGGIPTGTQSIVKDMELKRELHDDFIPRMSPNNEGNIPIDKNRPD